MCVFEDSSSDGCFITYVYIGVLLALLVLVLYDQFQNQIEIDDRLLLVFIVVETVYRRVNGISRRPLRGAYYTCLE